MSTEEVNENNYSLRGMFKIIGFNFKFLCVSTGVFAIIALIYAASLEDIYTSEALLSPSKSLQDSTPSLVDGGLGALVGLGSTGSANKTLLALQVIETKDFFKQFYEQDDFLVELSAVKSYDKKTSTLNIDESKYSDGNWIEGEKPNLQKAHRQFKNLLTVDHDRLDGFVEISIDHTSPYVAQKWLKQLIEKLNLHFQLKDKLEAQKSVEYLQKQMNETKKVDLKMIFSSMLVKQYEIIMLSEVTDEFIFEVLDEPRAPDKKSKPSRLFIALFLTIFGAFVFFLLTLFLNSSDRYLKMEILPPRISIKKLSDEKVFDS